MLKGNKAAVVFHKDVRDVHTGTLPAVLTKRLALAVLMCIVTAVFLFGSLSVSAEEEDQETSGYSETSYIDVSPSVEYTSYEPEPVSTQQAEAPSASQPSYEESGNTETSREEDTKQDTGTPDLSYYEEEMCESGVDIYALMQSPISMAEMSEPESAAKDSSTSEIHASENLPAQSDAAPVTSQEPATTAQEPAEPQDVPSPAQPTEPISQPTESISQPTDPVSQPDSQPAVTDEPQGTDEQQADQGQDTQDTRQEEPSEDDGQERSNSSNSSWADANTSSHSQEYGSGQNNYNSGSYGNYSYYTSPYYWNNWAGGTSNYTTGLFWYQNQALSAYTGSSYAQNFANLANRTNGQYGQYGTNGLQNQPSQTATVAYGMMDRTVHGQTADTLIANTGMPASAYNGLYAGMTQAGKIPAIASTDLSIREGKGEDAREIGRLPRDGLCYILADQDKEYVFVESGAVRGFVMSSGLITGAQAEQAVSGNGEDSFMTADAVVSPENNGAFNYVSLTTLDPASEVVMLDYEATVNRQAIATYALQFNKNPYVWNGTSLTNGCDSSGFTMLVYKKFGIYLPRTIKEQSKAGDLISYQEAKAGDLIFYGRNGSPYHVLIYLGNGRAISANSAETGIMITSVNPAKVCWAVNVIGEAKPLGSSTQVADLIVTGRQALNGDREAQQKIIDALANAADPACKKYGYPKSLLIAQAVLESEWCTFYQDSSEDYLQPKDNNVLSMNAELISGKWQSAWDGTVVTRSIPQYKNGKTVSVQEPMRAYQDIETCMMDYAAYKTGLNPNIAAYESINEAIEGILKGSAKDPAYQSSIKYIIDTFNLTKYDENTGGASQQAESVSPIQTIVVDARDTQQPVAVSQTNYMIGSTNPTQYTQEQLELIWAIVAQEDDSSYEGALAVISTAMNRAEQNYGGYGTDVLSQLTADGQFCYSPKVSNPIYYQRRLNGNVADYVKQAVNDCLGSGTRNHGYLNFRTTDQTGTCTQIGANWYY